MCVPMIFALVDWTFSWMAAFALGSLTVVDKSSICDMKVKMPFSFEMGVSFVFTLLVKVMGCQKKLVSITEVVVYSID